MCLSVYLGSHEKISSRKLREGALGLEETDWVPPALSQFPHRYYLGRKGKGKELECSCLLAQHVEWTESGPTVCCNEHGFLGQNPFDDLRSYVNSAQRSGKAVALACDDTDGSLKAGVDDDYDHVVISVGMITESSFLFAHPITPFPWRVFYVTASET